MNAVSPLSGPGRAIDTASEHAMKGDVSAAMIAGATALPATCYHCAQPMAADVAPIAVDFGGERRWVCCHGCAGAMQFIAGAGLSDYYRRREQRPRPGERFDALQTRWRHLDRDDALAALTLPATGHTRELLLELPDMTCAACAWLLESVLQQRAGVAALSDLANHRLRIRFDPASTPLSVLLADCARLGYSATPLAPSAAAAAGERLRRRELTAIGIAGIGAMQVMMLSLGRYLDLGADIGVLEWRWIALAEALITTFVLATAGRGLLRTGLAAVFRRQLTVDAPLAVGIAAGWLLGAVHIATGTREVYFDAVTMLVFLTLGTRYLEARLRRRAVLGIDSPTIALRLHAREPAVDAASPAASPAGAGTTAGADTPADAHEYVPATLLMAGDLALVRGGELIPADGELLDGSAQCDESALTGESDAVCKRAGDPLFAGTLNLGGPLTLRVRRPLLQSRLQQLQDSANAAADARALQPAWFDRVGHGYGLVMLFGATLAALGWLWVAPERAPSIFLAVLVVACPCALAVALPTTIAAANSGLLRRGALVNRADVFDTLQRVDTLVFDKTGTLARATAVHVTPLPQADGSALTEDTARAMAAALERHATHPIARLLAGGDSTPPRVDDVAVDRCGVSGRIDGCEWRIGTFEHVFARPPQGEDTGSIWLGRNGTAMARVDVDLGLCDGAAETIRWLHAAGYAVRIASGDAPAKVREVAERLGVPAWDAGQSAEDKATLVRRVRAEGHGVLMVGDGTNDAAALALADVGVAVAPGTALCQHSAGARILRADLRLLPDLLLTVAHARRIMRSNLVWALGYNVIALPLAAFGAIAPLWAAIGMSLSALVVVCNSLRAGRAPHLSEAHA